MSNLPRLPARDPNGHKGTFGTVAVIGGSASRSHPMLGAPTLAAHGAFRAGAGRVYMCVPEPLAIPVLSLCSSATARPFAVCQHGTAERAVFVRVVEELAHEGTTLAVGPGLGGASEHLGWTFAAIADAGVFSVFDADALRAIDEQTPDAVLRRAVLTPHPGEFGRLADRFGLSSPGTDDRSRVEAAQSLAARLHTTVVLKGARTVVATANDTWVCRRGHHCLATGGTGDVLTGVLAGLLAQHHAVLTPMQAATLAVEAHARAGEAWTTTSNASAGALAYEIADLIPKQLADLA